MSVSRHTTYNLLGALLPLGIALATVPLYLRVIGPERYGLLSICWLLLGYFGLFDFGISRAVSQRLASLRDQSAEARSETFWTGLALTLALAAIAVPLIFPLAGFALSFMDVPNGPLHGELGKAVPWLAAVVPFSLIGALLNGVLAGRERFGQLNLIEGVANLLVSIVPLSLAWAFGPQLWILLAGSLAAKLVSLSALGAVCVRAVPIGRPRFRRDLVGQLAGYGGWVSVSSLLGPLLALWDRFVIGAMLGPKAISIYVIPFSVTYRLLMAPSALTNALFPRFAVASKADLERLCATALTAVSVVMTPLVLVSILCAGPFFMLWLGREIGGPAAGIAYIFLPGIWANGLGLVALSILQGQGKPKYVALAHLFQTLPYAAMLYLGLTYLGLIGAALAWSLRVVADALILVRLARAPMAALAPLLLPAALIACASAAALFLPMDSVLRWALLLLLLGAGTLDSWRRRPEALEQFLRSALARLTGRAAAARP
ncbi:MAG TPA: oligosaccharide flippase family protein [Allosphingosinicella sp.]|nr:oligosaccharide flippase family protein [Allosphingosinicella sp.]